MSKDLRKAVIPVAGLGTRMVPATKAVPKELLPLVDRPAVQYVVQEAADAGISDVLFVTSREKRAIEDHFDRNPELEARLAEGGKESLLASINALCARLALHAVRQPRQLGLGDAVNRARRFVGDEPFICLLGDAVFTADVPHGGVLAAAQLAAAARELGTAVIGLEEVPADKVDRYGIASGGFVGEGIMKIDALVEKPSTRDAPSRLAIAARYVLTPAIFDCLENLPRGAGGEIQLTDALRLLLQREPIHGVVLKSKRHDIGNPVDWLKTNLMLASRRPEIWSQITPMLRELLSGGG